MSTSGKNERRVNLGLLLFAFLAPFKSYPKFASLTPHANKMILEQCSYVMAYVESCVHMARFM